MGGGGGGHLNVMLYLWQVKMFSGSYRRNVHYYNVVTSNYNVVTSTTMYCYSSKKQISDQIAFMF